MTNDEKVKCRQICKHYGTQNQCLKAVEEMAELQRAIVKTMIGDKGDLDNVIEEIADVEIMMEQLKSIFDPIGIDVPLQIRKKIQRQMERMEKEESDETD